MMPCFDDWKRFCLTLREIASGEKGQPLSGLEAQSRAQAVLLECGYTWPGAIALMRPEAIAPTWPMRETCPGASQITPLP